MHRTAARLFRTTTTAYQRMLFLSESHVRECITPATMMECLNVNRQAYQSITENGGGMVPTRLELPYQDQGDWSLIKPAAYYPPENESTIQMGLKVVSVRSNNPANNLPLVPATILLLEPVSGIVNAVIAATYLTGVRTAAGSAWATKLCQPQAKHLVLFGAGLQARCHIDAISTVLAPHKLERITIVNRSRGQADALVEQYADRYPNMDVILLDDRDAIQQVLQESADVVVCCTNTATPTLFDGAWLRPHTHVNGIGSYTPDMQEVDETVVNRCSTVLIDTKEARAVGDLKHLEELSDNEGPAVVMLGEALQDSSSLLLPDDSAQKGDITFYKGVGTAIQDVMTGGWVVKQARNLKVGQSIDMA